MFDELRHQFSKFLEYVAASLDISETHYKDAEARYQALCRWLGREESTVAAFNPDMYPQGSFRLGTVIKPFTDEEEYDIDLVCEISLTKDKVSQKKLKELVGCEIKSYAKANNMNSSPEDCRRCWKLIYADGAQFHMDILPAIPDGDSFRILLKSKGLVNDWAEQAIVITDKTLPNYDRLDDDWPRSNPRGYAEWFKERMEIQFDPQRKSLAESLKANVEDVPEYRVKTPLQRTIQILKRHRDLIFVEDEENKPISIIITTLAAQAYNNEADLLDTLINITQRMPTYIETRNGISWIPNPVNPLENFADKWERYPRREQNFRHWLQQVKDDLNTALESEDIKAIGNFLKPRLGERVVNKALKQFPQDASKSSTLIPRTSQLPDRFIVPHRQPPKWQIIRKGWVNITAQAYRDGFRPLQIQNDSPPLSKYYSLQFEAKTDILPPYKVYWQVVNTGYEARIANCLRGEFYDGEFNNGILVKGGRVRKESTLYTGVHWVECFIVRDSICVARSGEFIVNIK